MERLRRQQRSYTYKLSASTQQKYLKKIKGVFTSNIKRGSEFLRNFSANFLNGIDDQI